MHVRWRGMELPSTVTADVESLTSRYGRFVGEPFERGFGVTVGNSLRRILLSSLEGSAVTQVRVRGANHEMATVPGLLGTISDVILNVKSLVVQNRSNAPRLITVEKSKAGKVTGADIKTDGDVVVINPDHVLATLTSDVAFGMELVVENGRGYVPATARGGVERETGMIGIDAVFSPVTRVRYDIEETRVGQKTNYDRLIFEIWTNGSVHPETTLVEAARILRKHLNPFVQYSELGPKVHAAPRGGSANVDSVLESKLRMSLSELRLSVRAMNCLESEDITTVRDLVVRTEDQLLEVRNFGETTLHEVVEKLAEHGLHLGMRLPAGRGVR